MDTYITSFCTDVGIKKKVNQDSLCIKKALLKDKTVLMALVCDGMGGLSKGELASATVIRGFSDWFVKDLVSTQGDFDKIRKQWENLIISLNTKLWNYGKKNAAELGTTLTAILFVEGKEYLIAQVGDSRAYEIGQTINQITEDQSFVAREVKRGNMTKEQALPGIPILAPGERITSDIVNYIQYAKEKGCSLTGPQDMEIAKLNVVKK